jgi:hypothetical protein
MYKTEQSRFNCQLYVTARGNLSSMLPSETGPKRVITFSSVEYYQLIEPSFRSLLAAFESVPSSLQFVQV